MLAPFSILHSWGLHSVGLAEPHLLNQDLDMPGVCLHPQPGVGPPDDPVQDAHALVVILATSESSSYLHIELGLDSPLEVVEVLVPAEGGEIITVDNNLEIARSVGEAAG